MTYAYQVHGLRVESDIELPELRCVRLEQPARADLTIALAASPRDLDDSRWCHDGFESRGDEALLHVPGIGRFWARGGCHLAVAPEKTTDADALRVFLLGSGLAAILHQRGFFPLHASAFERDGRCIGFIGDSGNGKSTLAAMLSRRGFRLLAEDVLVAKIESDGTVSALPGVPILKLWSESLSSAGVEPPETSNPVGCAVPKHRLDAGDKYGITPVQLTRIYLLRWLLPAAAPPEITRLAPFDAILALRQNIYRESLIGALNSEAKFLEFATRLVASVGVYTFRRAMNLGRADEQVDALLSRISGDDLDAES